MAWKGVRTAVCGESVRVEGVYDLVEDAIEVRMHRVTRLYDGEKEALGLGKALEKVDDGTGDALRGGEGSPRLRIQRALEDGLEVATLRRRRATGEKV